MKHTLHSWEGGVLLCRDFNLAEQILAEAAADGMANDTTFFTVIGTVRATLESIIPVSLKKAMGASNFLSKTSVVPGCSSIKRTPAG